MLYAVIPILVAIGVLLFLRKQGAALAAGRAVQSREPLVPKDFWKLCTAATAPKPVLVWLARGITDRTDTDAYMLMMDILCTFQEQGWAVCILTPKFLHDAPSSVPIFQYYQKTFVEVAVQRADWLIAEHGTVETAITTAERARKRVLIVAAEEEIERELELARSYTRVQQQVLYTTEFLRGRLSGSGSSGFVLHPPFWAGKFKTHTSKYFVTLAPDSTEEERDAFLEICAAAPDLKFLYVRQPALPSLRSRPPNLTIWEPQPRRAIWSETAVLLVPSKREVWARTALEAAAAGIPTLAHPTESMKETMADAVQYRRVGNATAWASLLGVLMTQPVVYERFSRIARREADMRGTPAYDLERLKLMLSHGKS